jgi:hypothetical protein
MALGLDLAIGMAVFTAAGYYMDRRRGGGGAWTLCGMVLGLLYGAYEVWRVARRLNPPDPAAKPGRRVP